MAKTLLNQFKERVPSGNLSRNAAEEDDKLLVFLNQSQSIIESYEATAQGTDITPYDDITKTSDGTLPAEYHSLLLQGAELKYFSLMLKKSTLWFRYKTETKEVDKTRNYKQLKDLVVDLSISFQRSLLETFSISTLERS